MLNKAKVTFVVALSMFIVLMYQVCNGTVDLGSLINTNIKTGIGEADAAAESADEGIMSELGDAFSFDFDNEKYIRSTFKFAKKYIKTVYLLQRDYKVESSGIGELKISVKGYNFYIRTGDTNPRKMESPVEFTEAEKEKLLKKFKNSKFSEENGYYVWRES